MSATTSPSARPMVRMTSAGRCSSCRSSRSSQAAPRQLITSAGRRSSSGAARAGSRVAPRTVVTTAAATKTRRWDEAGVCLWRSFKIDMEVLLIAGRPRLGRHCQILSWNAGRGTAPPRGAQVGGAGARSRRDSASTNTLLTHRRAAPTSRSSRSIRRTTKAGNARLRWLLVGAAWATSGCAAGGPRTRGLPHPRRAYLRPAGPRCQPRACSPPGPRARFPTR